MNRIITTFTILLLLLGKEASGFVNPAVGSSKHDGRRHHYSSHQHKQSSLRSSLEPYETIKGATVIDYKGRVSSALDGLDFARDNPLGFLLKNRDTKVLLVVCPQLGDFDTWEYAELLLACLPDLKKSGIQLRMIGIGDEESACRFCRFTNFPLECLRVDKTGALHRALQLHGGPDWDIPSWVPQSLLSWFRDYVGASKQADERLVARAWLNYMAMCAGIAAPDTLPEIIRGYIGDKSAPERLRADEVVSVGDAIVIKGVTDVKLGPIEYQSLWKDAVGYQRPAELATVRLRGMVEVLSNFQDYVPDHTHLHLRGATFLLDRGGKVLYEHRDTGVLAYSKTMPRPLSFLEPYIGSKALNPLGLGDNQSMASSSSSSIEGATAAKEAKSENRVSDLDFSEAQKSFG